MSGSSLDVPRIGRPISDLSGVDLVAHTPSEMCPDVWHSLGDHLRAVGDLAAEFAEPFGGSDVARVMGYLHDAGKAIDEVQAAFRARHRDKGRRLGVPHKDDGAAILLKDGLSPHGLACATAIMGHHGGMPNLSDVKDLKYDAVEQSDSLGELMSKIGAELQVDLDGLLGNLHLPEWLLDIDDTRARLIEIEFFIRMCFSCLVDADFLDTAAHFANSNTVEHSTPLGFSELLDRFLLEQASLASSRTSSPASPYRNALFQAARAAAESGPSTGIYRMPAPTGSGKTASAAAFALEHARRYGKSRVVMAVPFTSITTQNAQVFRQLLQDQDAQIVLEHHSAIEDSAIDENEQRRLRAQNWDSEFIVTTTVQLFESLFSRKPAAARKLHRLANSVIVLDEVQALPLHWLPSLLRVLRQLTEHYGVTVLLASATQPAFWTLPIWQDLALTDIAVTDLKLPERVQFDFSTTPKTWEQVADEITELDQCLAIVNTTADAQLLHQLVAERADTAVPVLHLSTRMCGAHRLQVLSEVTARLRAAEPVILISTQVVEAGVDFDFPVVYRAMAPADSIVQAAGRCNREGLLGRLGRVVVFEVPDAGLPPGIYTEATKLTRHGLAHWPNLMGEEFMATYYEELFADHLRDGTKRANELDQARAALNFKEVHESFAMIDDTSVPVLVDTWTGATAGESEQLRSVLTRLDHDPYAPLDRRAVRTLARHTVQVPKTWRHSADVVETEAGLRWIGRYDALIGVMPAANDDAAVIW